MKASKEQITVLQKIKCREIVTEILDFGVNQDQIKMLIRLLALELEDRDLMFSIINAISNDIEVENKPQITI
jgi:hypothetical protein|tara:strand:- start:1468 stop:1683 length:216 start_codon:yes stop_codon:yes gene_type:complete